ncbi:MAG: DNA translocase FtsK [Spirochaetales bacterium]|nr:DNA translocase FtsK [Spirochaetales bacterium]
MAREKSGRRRPRPIMLFISILCTVFVCAVSLSPLLKLDEGSFLGAVFGPLHSWFDSYLNPLVGTSVSQYGLIPVCLLCLVNLVLAIAGSGILQFILRAVVFYGLYMLSSWFISRNRVFSIGKGMTWLYLVIAAGATVLSVLLLLLISKVRRKARPAAAPEDRETPEEVTIEPYVPNLPQTGGEVPEEEEKEPEKEEEPYVHDTAKVKSALASLQDVKLPEFQSFPNYGASTAISSIDRGIYDVAEREARIKLEEQKRREAELEKQRIEEERLKRIAEQEERERREAEENRKRLQNLFKPRTLMRRLNEDAQAEKSFPTYGTQVPDIDFGISVPREEKPEEPIYCKAPEPEPVREPEPEPAKPAASAFRPAPPPSFVPSDIPVAQQIPISQMRGMEPYAEETPAAAPAQSSIFREASEQADLEAELAERRRQAEIERKHLEEIQELERRRREAEEAAKRAEEELARTREEVRRAAEPEPAAPAAPAAPAPAPEPEKEEDGLSEEDMAGSSESAKAKGPDIDYVSGVGGLKSSISGNPYLIDRQKFDYKFPPESLLKHYPSSAQVYEDPENDPDGRIIVETFRQFRIETTLIGVQHGPTFTLYELTLAKGIKVSSVLGYSDNIAMELSVDDVRILAPIPGKSAIGVEVPNKKRDIIGFDAMMPALKAKYYKIPMVLGKNITGDSIVIDVAKTPHLLVAGTTGSGKSVCINGLICSVLYTKTPKEVRMILVDPKMVELSLYNGIPHLLTPVITDAKKALKAMNFVVDEMERRMQLFKNIGAKKIEEYNEKIVEKKMACVKLPYIMVIIDEFADLMLAVGKELEQSIKRITAVARFCGIHLILATQRPSADVITGIIKSNIPTQIAFAVSNSMNSRIIIDSVGAEKLLGRGDMLYNNPEARQPQRIQGAFIDPEIEEIVSFVKTQGEPDYIDESYFEDDEEEEEEAEESQDSGAEDLFSKAWKIVSDRGEASASYLQRRLNIGYNRAANLIEQMEDAGYIGPARGSKPREILKLYGSD